MTPPLPTDIYLMGRSQKWRDIVDINWKVSIAAFSVSLQLFVKGYTHGVESTPTYEAGCLKTSSMASKAGGGGRFPQSNGGRPLEILIFRCLFSWHVHPSADCVVGWTALSASRPEPLGRRWQRWLWPLLNCREWPGSDHTVCRRVYMHTY